MLHAVIMAGGAGTRFWPESRRGRPKQLLALAGERSMITLTRDRLEGLTPPERTLVVTNEALVEPIAAELPELPRAAIVGEPAKRDTAPCIGLAAMLVSREDPEATMLVLPSDHVIEPLDAFHQAVRTAVEIVEEREAIVTFGIPPTYPAEVYGYIQRGDRLEREATAASATDASIPVYRAAAFKEKPKASVAGEYLASGGYYWNSGMFVWKARTILDALAEFEPAMHTRLARIRDAWETPEQADVLRREYAAISGISIDYAVMERARDVFVLEAPFTWDDVGTWQSLGRLREADAKGNTIAAKHLGIATTGSIIRGEDGHLIVTLGLTDMIVVQTPDATLIADKRHEESIRDIVKQIEQKGWDEYL